MKWRDGRRSARVEDRRAAGGAPARRAGLGLGGLAVVATLMYLSGRSPTEILQVMVQQAGSVSMTSPAAGGAVSPEDNERAEFVSVVLADTEDVWTEVFAAAGRTYAPPTLVLFRGAVQSACGHAEAAMGPFYCPGDQKAYIDLGFYDDLQARHHAPGDFAQAYVIAHEIGHHIQNLLGASDRVQAQRAHLSKEEYNRLSVRLELQADYYAGLWAHHAQRARQILEAGDIEEALTAATAIGDDRLQKEGRGYVVPDSFTHGTSAQRVRWFRKGFESGRLEEGDTFSVPYELL